MNDPTRSLPLNPDATLTHTGNDPDRTLTRPASDAESTRIAENSTDLPQVLGYKVTRHIASGGMGAVYEARHSRMNRLVALKVIHGGKTANPKELIRFLAEAEAVAAIDHPNVVKVFDTGDAGGVPYLAMELLPGGTLAEKLKTGPIPPREAAILFAKLAKAVQSAHDLQIVHRDLKPGNVLFDAGGEPKLTDFGLAKNASGSDLTATQAIMGTPAYMAPEQAKGESKFVGPQADVWALGVMLYESLSGKKPFSGSGDYEVIRNVIEQEPSKLRSVSRQIPYDLDLIVQKCLQKDPTERYASASALSEDLNRWLAGVPISVKAAGPVERVLKWTKRNKLAAGLLAASILTALIMGVLVVWALDENRTATQAVGFARDESQRANDAKSEALVNLRTARDNESNFKSELFRSRRLLDVMRLNQANDALARNSIGHALDMLDSVSDSDETGRNRSIAWQFLIRRCEGADWTIRGYSANFVDWHPTNARLAINDDRLVRVINACDGKPLATMHGHESWVTCLAWSPNGKYIASGSSDKTVRIWDATTGECLKTIRCFIAPVTCIAWHPSGDNVAAGCEDGSLRIWTVGKEDRPQPMTGHESNVRKVAWSPNGMQLASISFDGFLIDWNMQSGIAARRTNVDASIMLTGMTWSPNGKEIVILESNANKFSIYDAKTWILSKRLEVPPHSDSDYWNDVAWSPDGGSLALCGNLNGLCLFNLASAHFHTFKTLGSEFHAVKWSPDSRMLATAGFDNTIRIWYAADGQSTQSYTLSEKRIGNIYWNGSSVLALSDDGERVVIDTKNNAVHSSSIMSASAPGFGSAKLSPDGLRVAYRTESSIVVRDCNSGITVRTINDVFPGVNKFLEWSPCSSMIAVIPSEGSPGIWKVEDGSNIWIARNSVKRVDAIKWSHDSSMVCMLGNHNTSVWNVSQNTLVAELKEHWGDAYWSPDNNRLAMTDIFRALMIWNIRDMSVSRSIDTSTGNNSVAWHPNCHILTTAEPAQIRLWDAQTGVCLCAIPTGHHEVSQLAWDPSGNSLACKDDNNAIRIWNVPKGQDFQEFSNNALCSQIVFSPDCKQFVTASPIMATSMTIWDTESMKPIRSIGAGLIGCDVLGWSEAGNELIVKSTVPSSLNGDEENREISVWNCDTGKKNESRDVPRLAAYKPPRNGHYYCTSEKGVIRASMVIGKEEEQRRRTALAYKPEYHLEAAEAAFDLKQWHTAKFHYLKALAERNWPKREMEYCRQCVAYDQCALACAKCGDFENAGKQFRIASEAVQSFTNWASMQPHQKDSTINYNIACMHARLCAHVETSYFTGSHYNECMRYLVKAKAEGYFTSERITHFKNDNDFHFLRSKQEFAKFSEDLRQTAPLPRRIDSR